MEKIHLFEPRAKCQTIISWGGERVGFEKNALLAKQLNCYKWQLWLIQFHLRNRVKKEHLETKTFRKRSISISLSFDRCMCTTHTRCEVKRLKCNGCLMAPSWKCRWNCHRLQIVHVFQVLRAREKSLSFVRRTPVSKEKVYIRDSDPHWANECVLVWWLIYVPCLHQLKYLVALVYLE